jgi:uncharacterized protein YejL (UPF0352 family)
MSEDKGFQKVSDEDKDDICNEMFDELNKHNDPSYVSVSTLNNTSFNSSVPIRQYSHDSVPFRQYSHDNLAVN